MAFGKKKKGSLVEPVLDLTSSREAYQKLKVVLTKNETTIGKLEVLMKGHRHPELFGFELISSILDNLDSYEKNQLLKISDKLSNFEDQIKQLKNKLQQKLDRSEDKIKVVSDLTSLKTQLTKVIDVVRTHVDDYEDYKMRNEKILGEENKVKEEILRKKEAKEREEAAKLKAKEDKIKAKEDKKKKKESKSNPKKVKKSKEEINSEEE